VTYFDAHTLAVGSRVLFPSEPIAIPDPKSVASVDVHLWRGHFYRTYKVSATWTSHDRRIVRVQLRGRGERPTWMDPVNSMELVK